MSDEPDLLAAAVAEVPAEPAATTARFDTCRRILALCAKSRWDESDLADLDFISIKVDIFSRLQSGYDETGRKNENAQPVDGRWMQLFAALLLKRSASNANDPISRARSLNTTFKALDAIDLNDGSLVTRLDNEAKRQWSEIVHGLPLHLPADDSHRPENTGAGARIRTIPLTVLFWEGPIARAYLETMRSLNMRPERILRLVPSRDVVTRKSVGRWLPGSLRLEYAASVHRRKSHFWAADLRRKHPDFMDGMSRVLDHDLGFGSGSFARAHDLHDLSDYSDKVEQLAVTSIGDPALTRYIENSSATRFLFTGGGILGRENFLMPDKRIVHIHPGHLPQIRGADCTLWSKLLFGRFSASCFYMDAGIDTGHVLEARWLPSLDLPAPPASLTSKDLYRKVFAFIDPWVRSYVFREALLSKNGNFGDATAVEQDKNIGKTFHFQHNQVQQSALSVVF